MTLKQLVSFSYFKTLIYADLKQVFNSYHLFTGYCTVYCQFIHVVAMVYMYDMQYKSCL